MSSNTTRSNLINTKSIQSANLPTNSRPPTDKLTGDNDKPDPNTFELPQTIDVEFIKRVTDLPEKLTKAERAVMRNFPNTRQGKRAARRHVEKVRRAVAKKELWELRNDVG